LKQDMGGENWRAKAILATVLLILCFRILTNRLL
jgi:hypothetical protein